MAKTNRNEARTAGGEAAGAELVRPELARDEAAQPRVSEPKAVAVETTVATVEVETSKVATVEVETSKVATVEVKTSVVASSVMEGAGEPRDSVNHLVITVHGIRTFGQWSGRLRSLLEQARPGIRVCHYNYGYFSLFAFLFPFLRWIAARRFSQALLREVSRCGPDARIDIVAHSFGTFLVAKSLRHLPAGRNIDTIIFAGSVLKPTFPWDDFTDSGRVQRVVNECGLGDRVLVVNQMVALFMGMAGRIGFHGMTGDQVVNRYYPFGHSGYFGNGPADNTFMVERWLPLLATKAQPAPFDARQNGAVQGAAAFVLNNSEPIKIAAYLALFAIPCIGYTAMMREGVMAKMRLMELSVAKGMADQEIESHHKMQQYRYLDMLSSTRIAGRDPGRVWERLFRDLHGPEGTSEDATDLALLRTDNMSSDAKDQKIQLMQLDAQIKSNKKDEHLLYHVKALVQQQNMDFEQARVSFEAARAGYEAEKEDRKRFYAQYLSDFGLLLTVGLREQPEAVKKSQESRRALGGELLYPSPVDAAFLVDSFCIEANACRWMGTWDQAQKCLLDAERLAENLVNDKPHILAMVLEKQAGLYLDMWRVEEANTKYVQARVIRDRQGSADREAEVAKFQIRTGEAMTKRLCGDITTALAIFKEVEEGITETRDKKDEFTPRERRMLRECLVTALERHADSELNRGYFLTSYKEASDIYGEAHAHAERLGNYEARARLLYKKCIAEIMQDQCPAAAKTFELAKVAKSSLLGEQVNNILLYQQIAQAVMQLHEKKGQGGGKGLRDILAANLKNLDTLKRDRVEMLLLASEILLTPELNLAGDLKPSDADLVFELMGSTIRGSSHPELSAFVRRYNDLATRAMGHRSMTDRGSTSAPAPGQTPVEFRSQSQEDRTFLWLRLSPRLTLTLSRGSGDSTPVPSHSRAALASGSGSSPAAPHSASGLGGTESHPPESTGFPNNGGSTWDTAKPVFDPRTGTSRFSEANSEKHEELSAARR